MKLSTEQITTAPFQWVEVTSERLPPFWYRTGRLLNGLTPREQTILLEKLRTGQPVFNEPSSLYLQASYMSRAEKQRLRHLLRYETAGFRLETFRLTTAMFFGQDEHYHSMNELVERGHLPLPAIALNPGNVCIRDSNGHLLDVFIPVGQARMNFALNPTSPC